MEIYIFFYSIVKITNSTNSFKKKVRKSTCAIENLETVYFIRPIKAQRKRNKTWDFFIRFEIKQTGSQYFQTDLNRSSYQSTYLKLLFFSFRINSTIITYTKPSQSLPILQPSIQSRDTHTHNLELKEISQRWSHRSITIFSILYLRNEFHNFLDAWRQGREKRRRRRKIK